MDDFSDDQKRYLEGFVSGQAAARAAKGLGALFPVAGGDAAPAGPEAIHFRAQSRFLAEGKKLVAEEEAKRKNPLDMWDELVANARDGRFPKGTDVFRYKFHGLFYVAPAQDAFMCRLRIPNGILDAYQLRAVADLAERYGGGYAHVTTRANLQIREIRPENAVHVLTGLATAGLTSRGAGADNIRNVTGNPTAGIDPQELYDARPLGLALHHAILNHRELYGLPRKFNIAFDGGGRVASLEDTNDIGFTAVRTAAGVGFRVAVGGITGHRDFARDLGVQIAPEDCVPVAIALVRVFIEHGDRTDRTKARMKYVLDRLGLERYLAEAEKHLGRTLAQVPLADCAPRAPVDRLAHVGFHPQSQAGQGLRGRRAAGRQAHRGAAARTRRHGGAPRRRRHPAHRVAEPARLRDRRRRRGRGEARARGARPRLARDERARRPRRVHRQHRLQVLGERHQAARARHCRPLRRPGDARRPGQRASHRLPPLLRPALHRRRRACWPRRCRSPTMPRSRATTSTSGAATAPTGRLRARSCATSGLTACPR